MPKNNYALTFLYENNFGKVIRPLLIRKWVSLLSGFYCDLFLSKYHIRAFVKKYTINMNDAQKDIKEFRTFNEFFIRKLKSDARPIDTKTTSIISPADGTLLVLENIKVNSAFPIKDSSFNLETFLKDKKLAGNYLGGTMLIFRLAPWDYHRFHFPVDCIPTKARQINGLYESVNPLVYKNGVQPLTENERHCIILQTKTFFEVIMVPVGALCVGRIVHTYIPNKEYHKGDEAGFFCFGGSTVVLLFKKNTITVDDKILEWSNMGREFPIQFGQKIAKKKKAHSEPSLLL